MRSLRRILATALVTGLCIFGSSAAAQDRSFDSNGVKICYTVKGKGEPVVLIHGFTVNYSFQWVWPGIAGELATKYQVIGMDCRGHGLSGKPHDPKRYGVAMVEDVVRLLDHCKIRKAHIVGYSMGGFITLKMLATHPDRMLTATTGGAGAGQRIDKEFLDELAKSLDEGNGITPLLDRLTPKGWPKPDPLTLKQSRLLLTTFNDPKALAAVVRGMRELAVDEKQWRQNRVPTLALVGEWDPFKEGVDAMQNKLKPLEIIVLKQAHHMNAFFKPEFTEGLLKFLGRHAQPIRTDVRPRGPMGL